MTEQELQQLRNDGYDEVANYIEELEGKLNSLEPCCDCPTCRGIENILN